MRVFGPHQGLPRVLTTLPGRRQAFLGLRETFSAAFATFMEVHHALSPPSAIPSAAGRRCSLG